MKKKVNYNAIFNSLIYLLLTITFAFNIQENGALPSWVISLFAFQYFANKIIEDQNE